VNTAWYTNGGQSEGLTWGNHIQSAFATSNVSAFFYWWGAAADTDNQALIYIPGDNVVVAKRLWAHAHFARFIHPGAVRIDTAVASTSGLNTTAFQNTDGTIAVQVINNGNVNQTVTLQGVRGRVTTWLTNNANDLTPGSLGTNSLGLIVGSVPARSLVSFVVGSA